MAPRLKTISKSVPAALAVVAVGACGSSPKYCSDRDQLQKSVKALDNQKVLEKGGVQKLASQLKTVAADAKAAASSAKSDFGEQTKALQSSVAALKTALEAVPSSPSPEQLAAVAAETDAVVTAGKSFIKATDSKCS
jgi:hypothetical protein